MNPEHRTPDPIRRPRAWDLVLWLLGRRRRFRVSGDSMAPTLAAGDHILVDLAAYRAALPALGDVVVARHPYVRDTILVKRVAAIDAEGRIALRSDNPDEGTDSRSFGALRPERILGKVIARVS